MSKPVTIGNATLYRADCMDVLPTLTDVDCVVTDPPYGVRTDDWDNMDSYSFNAFSMRWMSMARELSSELITFCTSDSQIITIADMLFPFMRRAIWHKPIGSQYAGSSEAKAWFSYEMILHCHHELSKAKPKMSGVAVAIKEAREGIGLSRGGVDMRIRGKKTGLCYRWEESACLPTPEQVKKLKEILPLPDSFDADYETEQGNKVNADTASMTDVFTYPTLSTNEHPCEKPERLMLDLLSTFAANADTILDPFMGSGTTGVACARLGRKFIGIEIERKYFDIACERIDREHAQGKLFPPGESK